MEGQFKGTSFAEYELSDSLSSECPEKVDLLINTSAVGLKGEAFSFNISHCVRDGGAVYDMVYAKTTTPLVADALAAGLVAADGRDMLAGQGEYAFELWFGVKPEQDVMRNALGG